MILRSVGRPRKDGKIVDYVVNTLFSSKNLFKLTYKMKAGCMEKICMSEQKNDGLNIVNVIFKCTANDIYYEAKFTTDGRQLIGSPKIAPIAIIVEGKVKKYREEYLHG